MNGLIVRGSKNIFTVRNDRGAEYECRLKGKVLKGEKGYYNPLAPGDRVRIDPVGCPEGQALIISLETRRNAFTRFNQKGQAPQLLAANLDLVLCVSTADSPPFRPRFLDRVLLQADIAGVPGVIVLNKCDLTGGGADVEERLEDYIRIGYRLLRISARTGKGLGELRNLTAGRCSVLVGQSGVGKTSLLNALVPGLDLRVGELCAKYDRGIHTTTMARLIEIPSPCGISYMVDTPGVRRLMPDGIGADDLALHLREFAPLVGRCTYGLSCTHITEPGCKIMEAVAAGVIHEDRYEGFLRLRDELAGMHR